MATMDGAAGGATWRGQSFGWGAPGHEWATAIAIEKLPDDIPAFVRDSAVLPVRVEGVARAMEL